MQYQETKAKPIELESVNEALKGAWNRLKPINLLTSQQENLNQNEGIETLQWAEWDKDPWVKVAEWSEWDKDPWVNVAD